MQNTNIVFTRDRDDYGRSVHIVTEGNVLIGAIVRLPKRTFPVPTFLVNDYRVTRGMKRPAEGVVEIGSLAEAKALFLPTH